MKKLLITLSVVCGLIQLSSCHKTIIPIQPPSHPPVDSTTQLLTGQTWVYYEYFYRFDSTVTSLAWKTGRSGNTLDLSLNQVKFNTDSTYTEIDQNGNIFNGTWGYLNNKTQVRVVNSQGTFISTIQVLTGHRYEWWDNATNHYGILVPRGQTAGAPGDTTALLTGKDWVYTEYFWNFGSTNPTLAWKSNKTNSPFNLSLNVVHYNPNGTYTETDQNGNVYNGAWTLLYNPTRVQVVNILGTFTSRIMRIDSTHFEWWEGGTDHYGEMTPR